jgi:hypothetical protein
MTNGVKISRRQEEIFLSEVKVPIRLRKFYYYSRLRKYNEHCATTKYKYHKRVIKSI